MNPYLMTLVLGIGIGASPMAMGVTLTGAGTTGVVDNIPGDVTEGVQEDSRIQLFREAKNIALPSALTVDIALDGTFTSDPGDSILATGPRVDVFLMHRDRVGSPIPGDNASGTIEFDGEILGVIVDAQNLADSENDFGFNSTTNYPSLDPASRSFLETGDELILSGSTADLTAVVGGSNVDQARFIVQAIPEPQTIALLPLGLLAMGGLYIRRRMSAVQAPQPERGITRL